MPIGSGHTATDRRSDPFRHRRQGEVPAEAETVATVVAGAYLPKVKAWKVPLKLALRLPSSVLIQRNCGRTKGSFLTVTIA